MVGVSIGIIKFMDGLYILKILGIITHENSNKL